jgi:hypothetical protein
LVNRQTGTHDFTFSSINHRLALTPPCDQHFIQLCNTIACHHVNRPAFDNYLKMRKKKQFPVAQGLYGHNFIQVHWIRNSLAATKYSNESETEKTHLIQ